jgi:hypothetical protein
MLTRLPLRGISLERPSEVDPLSFGLEISLYVLVNSTVLLLRVMPTAEACGGSCERGDEESEWPIVPVRTRVDALFRSDWDLCLLTVIFRFRLEVPLFAPEEYEVSEFSVSGEASEEYISDGERELQSSQF